jgi:ribonuclease-3 family protein
LLKLLQNDFPLSQAEQRIIVRGKNSGSVKGNRRKPAEYSDATGMEALLGYVYITDKARCTEIMSFLYPHINAGQ